MRAWAEAPVDPVAAEGWLEQAAEAARRTGNPGAIASLMLIRGRIASGIDRHSDAQRWFREAQAQFQAVGDTRLEISAQSELAHSLRRAGATDEAEAEYRHTILGWQRSGNRGAVANQLESLAFTALPRGDGVQAARLLGAAEALREAAKDPMTAFERAEYDTEVARLRTQLDPQTLSDAGAEGRALSMDDAVMFAISG